MPKDRVCLQLLGLSEGIYIMSPVAHDPHFGGIMKWWQPRWVSIQTKGTEISSFSPLLVSVNMHLHINFALLL